MRPIKLHIPTTWNELSPWQMERVALVLYMMAPSAKQDIKILRILLNARWWKFLLHAKIQYVLFDVPLSYIKPYFEYIFKENNRTKFLPAIKTKNGTLYPPMDRIINLTASEFAAADDLHIKFLTNKEPEYLQYLAAVLYTPNPRPAFDKLNLTENVKPFIKLPLTHLLAIQICYSGSKHLLTQRFKKAFPQSSKKTPQKYGFGKVILEMCKSDLSKHDKISNVNIYTFLEQFQQDIINASKIK